MTEKKEKKPVTVQFTHILIQFAIIIFFTITWLNAPLFGIGTFNVWYFLFMFIGAVIGGILNLYSKANPEVPIPKKPTQQFGNLVKAVTDSIASVIGKPNQHPQIQEFKDIVTKTLIWSLREAKISPESFDIKTLEGAENYVFDKLFPKEEKKGEEESQQGSQTG